MINEILDKLQQVDPLVYATVAAYFAPYAQQALKKVAELGEKGNYLVALIVIPAVIAALTGVMNANLLDGIHPLLQLAITTAIAALVSQLKYGLSLRPRILQKRELEKLRTVNEPPTFLEEAPVQNF